MLSSARDLDLLDVGLAALVVADDRIALGAAPEAVSATTTEGVIAALVLR